jgi:uncharacterized membrane protein YkoI
MDRKARLTLIGFALAAVGAGGAALAFADDRGHGNDALDVMSAQISLGQAVTLAEQHVGGKASRAEYERHKRGASYEVEVVTPAKKVFDVVIDPDKGTVLSSKEDKEDHEDGEDDDHR